MKFKIALIKCLFVSILVYAGQISAQHIKEGVKLSHYVFNEFAGGTVKMKSGEKYIQILNYNIVTGEMIFNNEGKFLAIANPENVDTIYINNRRFIPLNAKFYEVLVNTNMPLLLEFTSTINEPGVSIGYGAESKTTASQSMNSLISTGGAYDLKLPDGFTVTPGYSYWIMKEGKLEKAGSAKQLIKIFPDKKDVINDYVNKYHTNFSKREDIIILVQQIE
ncbi:MAG: hypothetical protein ABI863_22015 [Ginsengibacter sp.]